MQCQKKTSVRDVGYTDWQGLGRGARVEELGPVQPLEALVGCARRDARRAARLVGQLPQLTHDQQVAVWPAGT